MVRKKRTTEGQPRGSPDRPQQFLLFFFIILLSLLLVRRSPPSCCIPESHCQTLLCRSTLMTMAQFHCPTSIPKHLRYRYPEPALRRVSPITSGLRFTLRQSSSFQSWQLNSTFLGTSSSLTKVADGASARKQAAFSCVLHSPPSPLTSSC